VTKNLGRAHSATIVRTAAGRLAVAYSTDVGSYRNTRLIGSGTDGAAPLWSGDILWDNPSGSTNNANKDKVLYTLAAFSAAFPYRFVMVAMLPDFVDSTHYRQVSDTPDWDGTAFSAPAKTVIQGGVDGPDAISCVVDDGDRAHCMVEEASNLSTVHASTAARRRTSSS